MPEPASKQPGFFTTFVWPALWIFLVPVLTFAFFLHARYQFNSKFREMATAQVAADASLDAEEKQKLLEFYAKVPASRLVQVPETAVMFTPQGKSALATYRWMLLLSLLSIVISILTFVGVGICVLLSLKSQRIQYLSLSLSWYVLRLVGVALTVAQGVMLVALSYWVTALWGNVYSVKLIVIVGLIAIGGVLVVLSGFFTRSQSDLTVTGVKLSESDARNLWQRLKALCASLGTQPPDHLIAGIDDNFFVTELPVVLKEEKLKGRTLFVSLPLLKQLNGTEADAVLAHEMAHFSGKDTMYSRKISPLLAKYGTYLTNLQQGGATLPVFFFMNCFRAMFELSLGKLSREREFRADALAMNSTSPNDLAGALLRIVAYSKYRNKVQNDLFKEQTVLEDARIGDRVESGFMQYLAAFSKEGVTDDLQTSHPFDSHPSIAKRLEKAGVRLQPRDVENLLMRHSDGKWFHEIEGAPALERAQWDEFESSFREMHERSLPFRYLPSNEAEREIVLKSFPDIEFQDKTGVLNIDYEKFGHTTWEAPIHFREVTKCEMNEGVLYIQYLREGKKKQTLTPSKYGKQSSEMLAAFQHYYGRHLAAVEFQKTLTSQSLA